MHILFVCSGNACRSVMAEYLARKLLRERGREAVTVASCGTDASPLYRVPPEVVAFLTERGIDVSGHRSTLITKQMVKEADLILVMENYHRDEILDRFPKAKGKVFLLKEYTGEKDDLQIFDPIGQPSAVYRATGEEIERCIKILVERIAAST